MKRNCYFFLALITTTVTNAQTFNPCIPLIPKICINASPGANSVMKIDGQVSDWETILGAGTGDDKFPYSPPILSSLNWFLDGGASTDLDHPGPSADLRFFSELCDVNNFHFYFRRMLNGNAANSFFYFFDVNGDGFMGEGEPVVSARFNGKSISFLSLGKFVPDELHDYVEGKGNYMKALPAAPLGVRGYADGYTMSGSVKEIINGANLPADMGLLPGEIFAAAITENGYGVEFAVPKRFFKNWVTQVSYNIYHFYHVALERGAGPYMAERVVDNAGAYGDYIKIQRATVTTLEPGLRYQYQLTYENLANFRVAAAANFVLFKNIESRDGLPVNATDFGVVTYPSGDCEKKPDAATTQKLMYWSGSFESQPITFWLPIVGNTDFAPYATQCITIDVSLPANYAVKKLSVEFVPGVIVYFPVGDDELQKYCGAGGGGGKPINPVGFDISTDEEIPLQKNTTQSEEENLNRNHSINVKVYPNPNNGNATVVLPGHSGLYDIRLEDVSGKMIRSWDKMKPGKMELQQLKKGFYILRIRSADGKDFVQKIIVQ